MNFNNIVLYISNILTYTYHFDSWILKDKALHFYSLYLSLVSTWLLKFKFTLLILIFCSILIFSLWCYVRLPIIWKYSRRRGNKG